MEIPFVLITQNQLDYAKPVSFNAFAMQNVTLYCNRNMNCVHTKRNTGGDFKDGKERGQGLSSKWDTLCAYFTDVKLNTKEKESLKADSEGD